MKNVFDTLRHIFATVNVTHIVWCAAVLLTMLILAVLHHIWKDDLKKLQLWRLFCLVPLVICGVHAFIYVVGAPIIFLGGFFVMYIIAVLAPDTHAVCKTKDRLPYNRCADGHFVLHLRFLFLCDLAQYFQSFKGKLYRVFSFTCDGYGRTLCP